MATTLAPAPAGARGSAPEPGHRPRGRRTLVRYLPLVPSVVLLGVFMLGPVIWSFYGSFTNTALTGRNALAPSFVGLQNYQDLLADPEFPKSLWLTVVFVLASAVVGQNVLGLALAMLLRTGAPVVRTVVSTLVVVAWVLPEIVASFALYAFFHDAGTLNALLGAVGIEGPTWLYETPMLAVILANVWRGTAFSMLVYSAAVAEVPPELTEAARMDGATARQRLVWVILPTIRRSVSTNLMLTTLQTLSVFTLIYVMTGGGPGTDSSTLPILAYQEAFKFAQVGYGTAIATVMLLIGAIFSVVYIRSLRPEVD